MTIYTIGHSTRAKEEVLQLLKLYGIQHLVDIRRFPLSRKNPQFNRQDFSSFLAQNGILYHWMGEKLGGFRTGGYPAYMKSEPFHTGIQELLEVVKQGITAIMCAEKLWFRCHRRFISQFLSQQNISIVHILDEKRMVQHPSLISGV